MTDRVTDVVVGCGVVGLATALRLLERRPDLRIRLLDKEPALAHIASMAVDQFGLA